jgi:hypothetical protein
MYWKRRNSRFFPRTASFCSYVLFMYCTIPGAVSLFDPEYAMVKLFSGSIDVDSCSSLGVDVTGVAIGVVTISKGARS